MFGIARLVNIREDFCLLFFVDISLAVAGLFLLISVMASE